MFCDDFLDNFWKKKLDDVSDGFLLQFFKAFFGTIFWRCLDNFSDAILDTFQSCFIKILSTYLAWRTLKASSTLADSSIAYWFCLDLVLLQYSRVCNSINKVGVFCHSSCDCALNSFFFLGLEPKRTFTISLDSHTYT